jgi:spore maturation protein CgeB
VQEAGRRLTPAEYVKIFNATQINLNLHSSTERDGIDPTGDFLNPRVFELASCGAFQLADQRSLMNEIFTPGKDIITFDSTEDLKSKIDYYSNHPEERKQIAEAGRKLVVENHTYQHRYKEMLSIIYSSRFEQLKQREDNNPWKRIISSAKRYDELHERCEKAYKRGEEACLDALVADIVTGKGELSETEMKLLFLYHVSQQIIRHKKEEQGG